MRNEVWLPVAGYAGLYEVSNRGRVKSLSRIKMVGIGNRCRQRVSEIIRKQTATPQGYLFVLLCKNSRKKMHLVHRLVARAFVPNPQSMPQVNHRDGIKSNNRPSNLEWVTSKLNHRHAHRIGLGLKGSRVGTSKLTEKEVIDIRLSRGLGDSIQEIADRTGISKTNLYSICNRRSWKHI